MSKNAIKYRKPKASKHNQRCTANPDKVRYRDTKEAQRALSTMRHLGKKELEEKGRTKWNQKRYYHCPDCNGYHTTSQDFQASFYTTAA
ncbi:MAG: hypothetical protein ACK5GF_00610 [Rhodoluna sp.]|jgi:transcription initiation factor IIE alpha subunit